MTSTVYCLTKTTFCARLMQRLNFASCCKFKRKRGLGVTVEGLKIRRASALGGSTPPPGTTVQPIQATEKAASKMFERSADSRCQMNGNLPLAYFASPVVARKNADGNTTS